jgi:hypothetical protein
LRDRHLIILGQIQAPLSFQQVQIVDGAGVEPGLGDVVGILRLPDRFNRQHGLFVVAFKRGQRVLYLLKRRQHYFLILRRQFFLSRGNLFKISREPAAGKDRRQDIRRQRGRPGCRTAESRRDAGVGA